MKMKCWIILICLLCPLPSTYALENHVVINMGYDFGGEDLVNVQFSSGDSGEIRTDEGFYIDLGSLTVFTKTLYLQTTIGFKAGAEEALNGELSWKSMPLRSALLFRTGNYRLGGGLVYHMDPVLKTTGAPGDTKVKFGNTPGVEFLAIYAPYRFTYSETVWAALHHDRI